MRNFFENMKIRNAIFAWILITVVVMAISENSYFKNKSNLGTYFWLTIGNLIMLLWFIYKIRRDGINISKYIRQYKYKFDFKQYFKPIIINIIFTTAFISTIFSIIYIINPEFILDLLLDSEPKSNYITLIFNFTGTVILAPCVEELIFRGVILNRLRMKYSISKAIIVSSILFGIVHVDLAVVGAMIFGIMMCLIYIKTENIFITITIHIMNNFIMWLGNFIPTTSSQVGFSQFEIKVLFLVSIILLPVSIVLNFKYIKANWPTKYHLQ